MVYGCIQHRHISHHILYFKFYSINYAVYVTPEFRGTKTRART
jgi:hypothetical protein